MQINKASRGKLAFWDVQCDWLAMSDTPRLLSMGERCIFNAFSFCWVRQRYPCYILDEAGLIVIFDVDAMCPIWCPAMETSDKFFGTFEMMLNAFRQQCGIYINDRGEFVLDLQPLPTQSYNPDSGRAYYGETSIDTKHCAPLRPAAREEEKATSTTNPEAEKFSIWEDTEVHIADGEATGGDLAGAKIEHAIRNGRRGNKRPARQHNRDSVQFVRHPDGTVIDLDLLVFDTSYWNSLVQRYGAQKMLDLVHSAEQHLCPLNGVRCPRLRPIALIYAPVILNYRRVRGGTLQLQGGCCIY